MLLIQDLDFQNKTVFLRCDINSPIDPTTLKILDISRLVEVAETINALQNCKLVVASHQGRLGKSDYVSMEQHAPALSKLINRDVKFVADIFVKPARSINFITLTFVATRTGVDFSEVIT